MRIHCHNVSSLDPPREKLHELLRLSFLSICSAEARLNRSMSPVPLICILRSPAGSTCVGVALFNKLLLR